MEKSASPWDWYQQGKSRYEIRIKFTEVVDESEAHIFRIKLVE